MYMPMGVDNAWDFDDWSGHFDIQVHWQGCFIFTKVAVNAPQQCNQQQQQQQQQQRHEETQSCLTGGMRTRSCKV
jgi:hypothetical protein